MHQVTLGDGLRVWAANTPDAQFLFHELIEQRLYATSGVEIGEGNTVFDVGANIGLFAVSLARAHHRLTIHAFEPIPALYEVLRRNARLHLGNCTAYLHNVGLSRGPGTAVFQFDPSQTLLATMRPDVVSAAVDRNASQEQWLRAIIEQMERMGRLSPRLGRVLCGALTRDPSRRLMLGLARAARSLGARIRPPESVACQLRTVSEVIDEHGVSAIDLLKIDVEGSEIDVLAGIRSDHWARIRQLVVEVHNVDGRVHQVGDLLRSHGYTVAVAQEDLSLVRLLGIYVVYAVRADPRY